MECWVVRLTPPSKAWQGPCATFIPLPVISCQCCGHACTGVCPGCRIPTPYHTHVQAQAGQGPLVCTHNACACVLTRSTGKHMHMHIFSVLTGHEDSVTKEATWPSHHPPRDRGLGEQEEGGTHRELGEGVGERCWWSQMAVGAARAPEAQGRGEGRECAQQPGPAPPPGPSVPMVGAQTLPAPAQGRVRALLVEGPCLSCPASPPPQPGPPTCPISSSKGPLGLGPLVPPV